MERYAVLGKKEDVEQLESCVFHDHMVIKTNIPILLRNLREGDEVLLSNVKIFSSVSEFIQFSYEVQKKKARLRIVEQPALQIDSCEEWKGLIRKYLFAIAQGEEIATNQTSEFLCKIEEEEVLKELVCRMTIQILSEVFAAEKLPLWEKESKTERNDKYGLCHC